MKSIKYCLLLLSILAINLLFSSKVYAMTESNTITTYPLQYQVGDRFEYRWNENNVRIEYIDNNTISFKVNDVIISDSISWAGGINNYAWVLYGDTTGDIYLAGGLNYYRDGSYNDKMFIYNACQSVYCPVNIQEEYFTTGSNNFLGNAGSINAYFGSYWTNGAYSNYKYSNGNIYTNDEPYNCTTECRYFGSNINFLIWENGPINGNTFDNYDYNFLQTSNIRHMEIEDSGSMESFDLYYIDNNVSKDVEIEMTTTGNVNNLYPTQYKFYGLKMNQSGESTTYYWEEIDNGVSITNDTYTSINNGIKIRFHLDINTSGYKEIKVGIKNTANNYRIKYNLNIANWTDINKIGINYSKSLEDVGNKNEFMLIQKKNNNSTIDYRFYTVRNIEYDNITFYKYNKSTNEIKDNINSDVYKNGEKYIETGSIKLGQNSDSDLIILMEPMGTSNTVIPESYSIYNNTDVIFTTTNDINKIIVSYDGTSTTIRPIVNNDYIVSAENNVSAVGFDWFIERINDYKENVYEWNILFDSIWNNIPGAIQAIIVIIYFMMHCIGIFIIFKD